MTAIIKKFYFLHIKLNIFSAFTRYLFLSITVHKRNLRHFMKLFFCVHKILSAQALGSDPDLRMKTGCPSKVKRALKTTSYCENGKITQEKAFTFNFL